MISEGIDFKDEGCRAVIVIGIPYPPIKDKHVAYKMDYMDKQNSQIQETSSKNSFHMSGQQWYQTQAMKAINQAIGRVIRHVNDYGCVILLDKRYEQTKNYENISQWMRHMSYTVNPNARHRIHRDIPFERICGSVKQFFFQMKELYDKKESCKRRLIDDSSTDIIDITTTTTTTMTPSKQKKSNMDEIRNKLIENKKNPIELNEVKSSKLHSDIIDYQARLDLIKKQKNERKIHIINKKNLSNIQTINENSQTYNNVTKEENNKKILEFRKKMLKHCSKSVRSSFHEKMINYRKSTTDEEENRKNRFELYEFLPKHFPKQMLNEFAIIIPKQYIDEFKHEILLTERRNDNDEVVTID
ncbi:hypothetical protein SNEBB_010988 [Seison nebaliae]|nr:hypothetical protein SNEBB_010988 [Seison nebaliae]